MRDHDVLARPLVLPDAEIGANFWFVVTPDQMIVRLLARFYLLIGSEEAKLEKLQCAAAHDWLIARQFEVPVRFHGKAGLLRRAIPATPLAIWSIDAMMPLFEDAAKTLEDELPGFTELTLPQDPLTCFTPVRQHEDGKLVVALDRSVRF